MREELEAVLHQLELLEASAIETARQWGVEDPYMAQDTTGRLVLTDIIITKANVLMALANIERG